MLELFIKDTTVQSGTVPISWCVSPDTLRALADVKAKDPHILLVIVPKGRRWDERRVVVPMRDLMTFVEFTSPGEHTVFASIVTGGGHHSSKTLYLDRYHDDFERRVLDEKKTDFRDDWKPILGAELTEGLTASLDLDVPKGCFAPEPPAWEKKWVNHMWDTRPKDQCSYRRRRMWAYTGQILVFLFLYTIRLTAAIFLLLIGMRGVDLKPLYQPLDHDTQDVWDDVNGHLLVRSPYHLPLVVFTPIVVIGLFAYFWFTKGALADALLHTGIGLLSGAIAITLVALALVLVVAGLVASIGGLIKLHEKHEKEAGPWYVREKEMECLACDRGSRYLDVKDLPRDRRTIRLRFRDLKAKVCRPFAS